MNPLNPAQQRQMQAWAEQRDSLLREIATHTIERDNKRKEANAEALRLTDLHRSISNAEGSLSVLDRLEEVKKNSVSAEVADLVVRKSKLEVEIHAIEDKKIAAKREHDIIVASIADLSDSHGAIKEQVDAIKSILGHIKTTSAEHLQQVAEIVIGIRSVSDAVIDRSNENLGQTKIIIEKLPKYIFELQRPIPIRRTYPTGHPNEGLGLTRGSKKTE